MTPQQKRIEPEELRVGNYVDLPNWGTSIVKQIDGEGFVTVVPLMISHGDIGKVIEEIKRIQLTEEWLVRFGFVKNEYSVNGVQYSEPYFHPSLEAKGWLVNWNEDFGWVIHLIQSSYNMIPVGTVHRLQNLFYLLTGEELKSEPLTERV